jgi:hypothetical protein
MRIVITTPVNRISVQYVSLTNGRAFNLNNLRIPAIVTAYSGRS